MNPFDLKALVSSPGAQHPVAVHFPIALFMVSYAFDLLALWQRNSAMIVAARYNLVAAALAAPLALMTGLMAWQWKHEGVALRGNLRLHLIGALLSAALIWTLCWRRRRLTYSIRGKAESPDAWYFGLGFLAVAIIAMTAHIGGAVAG